MEMRAIYDGKRVTTQSTNNCRTVVAELGISIVTGVLLAPHAYRQRPA